MCAYVDLCELMSGSVRHLSAYPLSCSPKQKRKGFEFLTITALDAAYG